MPDLAKHSTIPSVSDTPPPPSDDEHTRIRRADAVIPSDNGIPVEAFCIPGLAMGRQIGQGGMAEVYEAEDRGFTPPRVVAVKLIERALSVDPEFRARFEREASIVAGFRHDNIVHIYSSGEVGGTPYLVMEYLPGGTLAAKLEPGPLPQEQALWTAARLADALAYSHACQIIHRDFKPGNVLFTDKGTPVLSDFGVAKSTSPADASLTRHASVIGAPRYMAPEQERGEEVTDRADVFSLALTCYEMLTGQLPPARLRVNPRTAELAPSLPGVAPAVVELIRRSLSAEPSERPSAREFEQILDDHDPQRTRARIARPPDAQLPSRAAKSRYPLWIALAVVAAGGVTFMALHFRSSVAPTAAPEAHVAVQSGPSLVRLGLIRTPVNARVLIDGVEASGTEVELAPNLHELAALAAGYYGFVQALKTDSGTTAPINVHLERVDQPTGAAFDHFLDIEEELSAGADGKAAATRDPGSATASRAKILQEIDSFPEPTLQTALRSKLLRLDGHTGEADTLERPVSQLARLGDARAASAAFLIAAASRGRFTADLVSPQLTQAAAAGDAFATFLLALPLRDEIQSDPAAVRANPGIFRNYCDQLKQALARGWDGLPKLYRDDCRRLDNAT